MKAIPLAAIERVRRFGREVKRLDVVGEIVRQLNSSGEAYLFGGGARDACFGRKRVVNDLDVVVSGKVDVNQACFRPLGVRRTNFGGYRFNAGQFEMDVWQLDESYAFVKDPKLNVGISSLLDTVCFSTDSIALSLESGAVFVSSAFRKSLEERTIGFVAAPEVLDPLIAARAARLLLKLDLVPTFDVASYLLDCAELFGVSALIEREVRWHGVHYLNEMSLDAVLCRSSRIYNCSGSGPMVCA